MTYGPFALDDEGQPFPPTSALLDDFARMRAASINAVRVYHLPPQRVLDAAASQGLLVFLDVPWSKHVCFLDSRAARDEAFAAVRHGAQVARHDAVFALSIVNEIPPDIVRWHGARHVERFLRELYDAAREANPDALVTCANFPPTEYLDLSFLDFVTFNVYLHDRETFRRYLHRLQNIVGERPLLLGELGMDTLRHGEQAQADFLAGHLSEAMLTGAAGAFIFSWTDEWHTGGFAIEDWAFGITSSERVPKESWHRVREVFGRTSSRLLKETPRVSVVVCSYNGGRTLEQCLRSLQEVDYPDYEVIVVDDGSTDDTQSILARFPGVRNIRQENLGLSAARNTGLYAATGSLVAYTDSDCFADPDWLSQLVHQFQETGAAAVGGPNLSPDDGWLTACVAASPGQPTHVLENHQVAEHIPGCNMAFRREALLAINGFDPTYRIAGDDVDVCWRLQQSGEWITFAPGAFVWHHRRHTVRAYLRQQAGYGEAEALLRFKHPDRFNSRGEGRWSGGLYGDALKGLRLGSPIIYRGAFGTGFFQCLYQPQPAHWAMLPSTLEWHAAALLAGLLAFACPAGPSLAAAMFLAAIAIAILQARQAKLPAQHEGWRSRLLVAALCYAQPLVRSWSRLRTWMFRDRRSADRPVDAAVIGERVPLFSGLMKAYWTEDRVERTDLLERVTAVLADQRWARIVDAGWHDWDLAVFCDSWTSVRLVTAQEEHGGGKRLLRVRYRIAPAGSMKLLLATALVIGAIAAALGSWPVATIAAALGGVVALGWTRGPARSAAATGLVDAVARQLGLGACDEPTAAHRMALAPSDNPPGAELPNGTAELEPTPSVAPASWGGVRA